MKKLTVVVISFLFFFSILSTAEASKWFTKKGEGDNSSRKIDQNDNQSSVNIKTSNKGKYERIYYPVEMEKKLSGRDTIRVAGTEVAFRFIKKKSSLGKYPHKLMEAMAWMEVLYNEKLKNLNKHNKDEIEPLFEVRNSMRETMGLDINLSAQEAIDYYWSMHILLSNADVQFNKLSNDMVERKEVINEFKTNLVKFKNSPQNNSEIKKHIKSYQQKLKSLSEAKDPEAQVIDVLLKEVNKGLGLIEESIKTKNKEVILSSIELVEAGINDVASYIPKEKETKFDNINYEEILTEKQIESLSLTAKNPDLEKKQDVQKFINNVDTLHQEGIKAVAYADNVGINFSTRTFANGLVNKRVLTNLGTFATYTAVRRINNLQVEAQLAPWQRKQTLVHRKPVFQVGRNWFGGLSVRHVANYYTLTPVRVWPRTAVIFDPVYPVIVEEDKGPPEFWETEEYRENFYEAYDRVQWPHLNKDNPLTREDFKKDFPVYPDGIPVGDVYENILASVEYKGPPIEWEGLTEDGKCLKRVYWCPELAEYQMDKLKNTPTLVTDYDDMLQINSNAFANIDGNALSKNIDGNAFGENIDVSNINNNTIDMSSFTKEIDNINETVSQVTGNIANSTDSIDSFMEQVDNLNESVAQVTESMSQTVSEISDSINTDTISTSVDEVLQSFDNIQTTFDESMQKWEQESQKYAEDMMKATEQYLSDIANSQPCVGHIDMKTFEQTYSGDCD